MELSRDFVPGTDYFIQQSSDRFKYGADSLILSSFLKGTGVLFDLGCGTGILSLRLADRFKKIIAIENDKTCHDIFKDTISKNSLDKKIKILYGQVDRVRQYPTNYADAVVINPPYFTETNIVKNRYAKRACDIKDFVDASRYILKNGGDLFMIYPVEKMAELIYELEDKNLRVKNIIFIKKDLKSKAKRFVIRARKDAKPKLIIRDLVFNDCETNFKKIYENEVLDDLLLPNSNR